VYNNEERGGVFFVEQKSIQINFEPREGGLFHIHRHLQAHQQRLKMETLPNELLEKILVFVPGKDLAKSVALVNRRFLALTRSTPFITHLDITKMSMLEATKLFKRPLRNLHTLNIGGKDLRQFESARKGVQTKREVRTIVICIAVKFLFNRILSLQVIKSLLVALNSGRTIRKLIITDSKFNEDTPRPIRRLLGNLTHLKMQNVRMSCGTHIHLPRLYVYSPLFVI
jgi:hypothetical protein